MPHSTYTDPEVYNGLPDVLVADARLNAMGKTTTLRPLCKTILKYGLEQRIGIRLLHNHNTIDKGEMMLEQEEIDSNGQYCLSTVAVRASAAQPYANSWLFRNRARVPLEYSLDPMVSAELAEITSREDFFSEFQHHLEEINVSDFLGLCILKRSFYEERRPADGQPAQLVETTDSKRRANILKFYPHGQFDHQTLIETVWMAMPVEAEVERLQTCSSFCAPVAVIHCEPNDDGTHGRTTTNSHNVGHETRNP